MTRGHIRHVRAARRLLKLCCRGDTVTVTAPLLPQRVSPVVTPDDQDFTVCVCVCVFVCNELFLEVCVNEYLCFYIWNHTFPIFEFTCCCLFCVSVCVFVYTCGCACTEELFSNSMRCCPSYCLNIPSASSTHPDTIAL